MRLKNNILIPKAKITLRSDRQSVSIQFSGGESFTLSLTKYGESVSVVDHTGEREGTSNLKVLNSWVAPLKGGEPTGLRLRRIAEVLELVASISELVREARDRIQSLETPEIQATLTQLKP